MIAEARHGEIIRELIGADLWEGLEAIDWRDLGGQWALAVMEDVVVACVQLLPGKPIGRMENMGIAPGMAPRDKAAVVSLIITYGQALLKAAGSQVVMTMVPKRMESYQRVLERRGAVSVSDCKMMIKRLD